MKKYRLISIWQESYSPKHHKQDGTPQERVEEINLTLEEASSKFKSLYTPSIKKGWSIERYEFDDGKYRAFELIMINEIPTETPNIPKVETEVLLNVEVYTEKKTKYICDEISNKKNTKYKATPFCRCLNEIENNLPVTEYCFMACPDQKEILRQRKQEKRNEKS